MRRYWIGIGGLVAGLLVSLCARPVTAGFLWGAQVGVQRDAPQVRDMHEFGSEGSLAPIAGAFAGWRSRGRWAARVEVELARRSFTSPAFVTDTPLVADFLELGLLAAWRVSKGSSWTVRIEAGPQVGLVQRARRRFRDVDQDVMDELREADLKAILGLRVERHLGAGRAFVSLRFGLGLTNLDTTNQQEIRARTSIALLGYER